MLYRGKILAIWPLGLLLFCSCWRSGAEEWSLPELYQLALPSMAALEVTTEKGDVFFGSGFLACRPGVVVTAWHVVQDAVKIEARFQGGKSFEVSPPFALDEAHDLAFLRMPVDEARPVLPRGKAPLPIGSSICVIGSPRGYAFSITDGIVSQVRNVDGFEQYQISCPISPGSSGSPILSRSGEVIGVCTWMKARAQNVNFGTPARFVEDLALRIQRKDAPPIRDNPQPAQLAENVRAHVLESSKAAKDLEEGVAPGNLRDWLAFLSERSGSLIGVSVRDGGETRNFEFVVSQGSDSRSE